MISGPPSGSPDDAEGEEDGSAGGWIPPEQRAWRHPSELFAGVPALGSYRRHDRRGPTVLVGATAAAAIAVGLLLLVATGSGPGQTALDTMPVSTAAVTQCCRLAATLAATDEASVVSLAPRGSSSRTTGCGVVVGDGDLVATTEDALHGARKVEAVSATGHHLTAVVIATDADSGVALLRLSSALQPAPVEQVDGIGAGSPAMAVAMTVRPGSTQTAPRAVWTSGTVTSVGDGVEGAPDAGMGVITLRGRSVPDVPGEPLVSARGAVVGILAGSTGSVRTFLPMPLVVGVSDELESTGRVHHGWLDLVDSAAPGSSGALVDSVDPNGASAGALQPGDVILRIDDTPVSSPAQLRSLLYVLPPGAKVTVAVRRGHRVVTPVVALAPTP